MHGVAFYNELARRWSGRSADDGKSNPEHFRGHFEQLRGFGTNIARWSGRSTLKSRGVLVTLVALVIYRGFPAKLHHGVPHWVEGGSPFHIRIRSDLTRKQPLLTDPPLATKLLDSARFYETKQRWHIIIFLLMPDHAHAILSFGRDNPMSVTIGDWKHFHKR